MMKTISLRGSLLLGFMLSLYSVDGFAGARYRSGGYDGGFGYGDVLAAERAEQRLKAHSDSEAALLAKKEELNRLANEVAVANRDLAAANAARTVLEQELARDRMLLRQVPIGAAHDAARQNLQILVAEEGAGLTRHDAQIARLEKIISRYNELIASNGGVGGNKFDCEIERLKKLEPTLVAAATGRREMNVGQLVARGIAGSDFDGYIDYGRCDTLWDGMKQGFILGTAKEFGDFVRTKMRGVFQDKLGSIFDAAVNGLTDGFQLVKEALFHESKKPFSENELGAWQSHIITVLGEIEKLSTTGMRDVHRGQDSTMRQTQNDMDDLAQSMEDLAVTKPAEKKVRIWADLFSGYVLQLSYYILILQDRKGYYTADSFEVFFATHLEERLKQFCELLMKINDVADLETHLAVNRASIPPFKSNIDNLFNQLKQQVKPRSFSTGTSATSSIYDRGTKTAPKSRYSDGGYDADDGGPQSTWAR